MTNLSSRREELHALLAPPTKDEALRLVRRLERNPKAPEAVRLRMACQAAGVSVEDLEHNWDLAYADSNLMGHILKLLIKAQIRSQRVRGATATEQSPKT